MATVQHAVSLAHSLGKTVVLNPAPAQVLPTALLSKIDYLVPSEIEVTMLTDTPVADIKNDNSMAAAISTLRERGGNHVLVTWGEKGVFAALTPGLMRFVVIQPVQPAAGDTFIGGSVAALVGGCSEVDAIAFGQRAVAFSVTRAGAQTSIPYRHELNN